MRRRSEPAGGVAAPAVPPLSQRRRKRAGDILAAAREVFLEKGFERTAVSEIAARVGIVEGSVFGYFPTKRDLLHAVLGELYEPLIRDVGDGYARLHGLRARLRFIVWRHVRVYVESPGMARLVLHEIRTGPESTSSGLHALHRRYTRFVGLALDDAVKDGELDAGVEVEMLRSMLYGGLEHLMWPVLCGGRPIDVDGVADRYTDRLMQGLRPARGRGPSDIDARLVRLEALVAALPLPRRGRPP